MLKSLVSDAAEKLVKKNRKLITRLVWDRAKFENWLQLEILNNLQESLPAMEIEKGFPNSKERCDFWLAGNGSQECWLELKLCVTNYCTRFADGPKTRPITNQIQDILRDSKKLKRIPRRHETGVLILVYPLPANYKNHPSWNDHLAKVRKVGKNLQESFSLSLKRNGESCMLVGYAFDV